MHCINFTVVLSFIGGSKEEEETVKYVSLDLSSIEGPVPDLPALRILEVTEVQDLSAGVRVPDLERFMTVLHPSSAAEASFGPPGTYRLNPLSSKIRFKKFQKIVFNMSLTINMI